MTDPANLRTLADRLEREGRSLDAATVREAAAELEQARDVIAVAREGLRQIQEMSERLRGLTR